MKPRIVFFIPGLNVGGAERHTLDLRVRLEALGYPTGLIVHGRRRTETLLAHPGTAGAVFLDLKGMSQIRGWLKVRAAFKREAPDVIVAINQTPLIVSVVTRLFGGTHAKLACVFHTTLLRQSEVRRFFLFRFALKLADLLIFVSSNQKDYWTARGLTSRAVAVIRNGVDFSRFGVASTSRAKARADLGFTDDDYVLGIVAALRPEKNHLDFIRALRDVRARGVNGKAVLVGDGSSAEEVKARTEHMGMSDHVLFAGEQADVRPFISASDAGVLCSNAVETFSLSALEFLASGVPMIMSRIGGASEIVDHGVNGLLYDAGETQQLAESLCVLADTATRQRMASAARDSIKALSIDAMVRQYAVLFERLTTKSPHS